MIQEVSRRSVSALGDFQEALKLNPDRPVFMRVFKPSRNQNVFIAVPR